MKGMVRVYYRAAVERSAKQQLQNVLSMLVNRCMPPRQAPAGTDDLHRAMMQMTFWPSADVLGALDLSVKRLAMLHREKVPKPLWKAFELVNRRWPGFRLIRRLDGLVSRARKLLEEAGESDLTQAGREARGSGERASETKKFLADLRKIQKDIKEARKIRWQNHEHFLFQPGVNKRVQLACGDAAASPRVMCYSRALEIIVDDELRKPLRDNAWPLLGWIAHLGNPAYSDVLKWNDFMEWMAKRETEREAEERVQRKRAQDLERQKRHRKRKISR
jgi:hypothetical protein